MIYFESLNSIDKIKKFVKIARQLQSEVLCKQKKYVVDGKSIMGIFSLDLTKEIEVNVLNDNKDIETEEGFELMKL